MTLIGGADRTSSIYRCKSASIGPCFVINHLKTITNHWCSSSRFGKLCKPCWFCGKVDSERTTGWFIRLFVLFLGLSSARSTPTALTDLRWCLYSVSDTRVLLSTTAALILYYIMHFWFSGRIILAGVGPDFPSAVWRASAKRSWRSPLLPGRFDAASFYTADALKLTVFSGYYSFGGYFVGQLIT